MEPPDLDLTRIFAAWPYEAGRVNVRLVKGLDGAAKIQVRVDLGILQLETAGRPDGLRPDGFESLLHLQRERIERSAGEHNEQEFVISSDECASLREEAVQYYHRYVAFFVLEDYAGVVRDTTRNLDVFDICNRYGEQEHDREVLEQFRPYVIMMRTRAQAAEAMRTSNTRLALLAINHGLDEIRQAFRNQGTEDRFETANEVQLLHGLRDALVPKLPSSQRMEIQERLSAAIAAENYELAAILRDELRMLE